MATWAMTLKHAALRATTMAARVPAVRAAIRAAARRGRLRQRVYWDMEINNKFDVRVESATKFRYAGDLDDVVARHLFWGDLRRWERETWREFLPLARSARWFVDIGAFTGAY